jgi:hypothetical protein
MVFVPQGNQLTSYFYPSFLVVHMNLIAWMRLRAGVEWALLLRILPGLQAVVGCFR